MTEELKKSSEKRIDLRHIIRFLKETLRNIEYQRKIIKNMNLCVRLLQNIFNF